MTKLTIYESQSVDNRTRKQSYNLNNSKSWQNKPALEKKTAWKVSKYGVFSGPYFPVLGLNTEIYGVNFHIQSEYGKNTENTF